MAVRIALTGAGYSVTEAADGADGWPRRAPGAST
jgi:hypothetical protein